MTSGPITPAELLQAPDEMALADLVHETKVTRDLHLNLRRLLMQRDRLLSENKRLREELRTRHGST